MELNISHTLIVSHVNGKFNHGIPCAVCHVSNRAAVYMVSAKYTYLVHHWTEYTCMDTALKAIPNSSANHIMV